MDKTSKHLPVKLITGFIYKEAAPFLKAKPILTSNFGPIDYESPALPFDYTDYYEKEFGKSLSRKFVSFRRLVAPQNLAGIKRLTNRIEQKFSAKKSRRINLDPGYITLAKLVLATTKDFAHRIYLAKGIFGEVTLSYRDKSFLSLDWTYPDYRSAEYIAIFNQIRKLYAQQI